MTTDLKTNKRTFMVIHETQHHVYTRPPSPRPIHSDLVTFAGDFEELYVQGYRFVGSSENCFMFEKPKPSDFTSEFG